MRREIRLSRRIGASAARGIWQNWAVGGGVLRPEENCRRMKAQARRASQNRKLRVVRDSGFFPAHRRDRSAGAVARRHQVSKRTIERKLKALLGRDKNGGPEPRQIPQTLWGKCRDP